MEGTYTVSIYTLNQIGLLAQISNVFTRRSLSIWSMLAQPTPISGVHSIAIVTEGSEKKIFEAVQQLEKRIDVIKVFYTMSDRSQIGDPDVEPHLSEVSSFLDRRMKETTLKA